jgi:hypothetical protein
MALDEIGQVAAVNSINPPTPGDRTAALAARHYDACRQNCLRSHVWHFATQFSEITRIGTPLSDWSDQYQLPADFIRFLSINGNIEYYQTRSYKILGDTVCINYILPSAFTPNTSNATALLRYIFDQTDISKWVADAKYLFALMLAEKMAYAITKQNDVVARIQKTIERYVPSAFAVSGQENTPIRIENSKIISNRRLYGIGGLVAPPWTYIP